MAKKTIPARSAAIRFSLQSRLILYVILLLTLLMMVTTYAGIRRESEDILGQMKKDGVALANSYALSAENAILLKAGLGRLTGEASRTQGVKYLKIIDHQKRIMGHTDVLQIGSLELDPVYDQALTTPITAVEKGKKPITLIDESPGQTPIFRVIVPLVILDRVIGVLEVGLDTTGISEAIRRTNNQSLLIAMAAFTLGGLCVWFFARSLTRPIRKLMEAVERVAAGDLEHEIRVTGRDEIGHLALSFNDMTRRLREYTGNLKKTNAQLEANAAIIDKLRSYNENILNSINPGVLTLDLDGRITTLNQAGRKILQLEPAEVIGRRLGDVFPPEKQIGALLRSALAALEVFTGHEVMFSDGTKETRLIFNTALLYEQNIKVVGIAATFEDITEMRQLQMRIHESEKLAAMGGLAVGIAHEVRNPLGAIKTSAQFLKDKFEPEDTRSKFPQIIIREVERLDQLVERMLDFTRPAEKDFQYEDIHDSLESVATLAALKADKQRLIIRKVFGGNIPRLFVDAKRLQQAFLNIMLNAIDAMPSGGTLTLQTAYDEAKCRIIIDIGDSGEGIPAEQVAKIFNPFFTTRVKGTGLGLAIVHQIILEHNGTISVQSTVGTGTTFTIHLPLRVEPRVG